MNADKKLTGRGIQFDNDGIILIGYYDDGYDVPGNEIYIWSDGEFTVGEKYNKADGHLADRYTWYNPDGTTEELN